MLIYFYNPNIHPQEEYVLRKNENMRFADKLNIPFIDADYDTDNWFARAKGREHEPERGIRCTMCFDMRFERTALYAHENGYPMFTSCLGISRWKNMDQINSCGHRAAAPRQRGKSAASSGCIGPNLPEVGAAPELPPVADGAPHRP
jgi:predicted adenine nucleotide alpha hydrolase (AANH) superfamily ATPase